jgi:hypothetical protein
MKNLIFLVLFITITFYSCSEKSLELEPLSPDVEESSGLEGALKASATGITVVYKDRTSYISGHSPFLNPSQINLNRVATGGSSYTTVYGFNVPDVNRARGFRWNSGDETTSEWRPQGITGFTWNGIRYLLISWYDTRDNNFKGSRVTLVNISPSSADHLKYRHILLVYNVIPSSPTGYTQLGMYAPFKIHAGGLAYKNGKLYVANTSVGLAVFDLNKIIEVGTGTGAETKCGKDASGNMYAFDYRYILPQIGYYRIEGGANPFSCVSLDESGTSFWTGQYSASNVASSVVPKVYGFPINSSGTLLNSGIQYMTPKNGLFTNNHAHGIQGVFRKNSRVWISCTGMPSLSYGSDARLARYTDGASDCVRYRWPYGAEDLYYESSLDYLWCLTEFEPNCGAANGSQVNRCVFAVKFANYE